MTFGEKRTALRRFRAWAPVARKLVNGQSLAALKDFSLTLSDPDYDACEWAIAHTLKAPLPESYDEDGEPVGPWRLARIHGGYRKADEPREHFLFKGVPVFRV